MLMGIILHVAWLFIPYESGAPIMDVAANQPCNYVFYVTHIFRMQVFYLLAGFFARLVFLRLGYIGFAWHRFSRIAVPFAAGWLIMYPLFTLYWVWGGIQSGRIIMTEPFWSFVLSRMLADELSWFSLTHLWFLYYLLLIYVLAIAAELLVKCLLDRRGVLRQALGRLFHLAMSSRLNVLWLSIPLWFSLWWIGDWFGITTPSDSLRPHVPVLVAYSYFFFIGWLLHGQAHLLARFTERWQFNLVCGLIVSVPLFLIFTRGNAEGYITWQYPMVFDNEIRGLRRDSRCRKKCRRVPDSVSLLICAAGPVTGMATVCHGNSDADAGTEGGVGYGTCRLTWCSIRPRFNHRMCKARRGSSN